MIFSMSGEIPDCVAHRLVSTQLNKNLIFAGSSSEDQCLYQ